MKNFNILSFHWKIQLIGGEFTKNRYRRRMPKRGGGGGWTVCRFKGGAWQERGGGVFWGGVILWCIIWIKYHKDPCSMLFSLRDVKWKSFLKNKKYALFWGPSCPCFNSCWDIGLSGILQCNHLWAPWVITQELEF